MREQKTRQAIRMTRDNNGIVKLTGTTTNNAEVYFPMSNMPLAVEDLIKQDENYWLISPSTTGSKLKLY